MAENCESCSLPTDPAEMRRKMCWPCARKKRADDAETWWKEEREWAAKMGGVNFGRVKAESLKTRVDRWNQPWMPDWAMVSSKTQEDVEMETNA